MGFGYGQTEHEIQQQRLHVRCTPFKENPINLITITNFIEKVEPEIIFQIILIKPTPDVVFGLQKGSGNNYETVQKQISKSNDLAFTFTIKIKGDKSKDKFPKLTGNFVQGSANNKFVYIDIGTYAGQTDTIWSRRLKVPLTGITWKDIDSLPSNSMLQTMVPGIGKDGGPNCATVKPFAGWHQTIIRGK